MRIDDLSTPALLVDQATLGANLDAADRLLAGTGKHLRPHVKTHRTPALALRQQRPGARGVTCATVGEAEAMVDAGIADILIANEIVSEPKIARIASLANRARIVVAVDAAEPLLAFSRAASRAGAELDVLVDVDVGLSRCGVASAPAARALAILADTSPGMRFAGLMGYEGRLRESTPGRPLRIRGAFERLEEARAELERAGLEARIVSGAGTSTLLDAVHAPCLTEIQAGTYALMEDDLDELGLPFRCAVSLTTTVISRSGSRIVVDTGRKTAGCEYGPPRAAGAEGVATAVSEEHTVLEWHTAPPAVGERVRLVPSNVRTTFNLHAAAWLVAGADVVERLDVTARGRSQ